MMENDVGEGISPANVDDEEPGQQSTINISDVIEVIRTTDPTYRETVQNNTENMFGGGQMISSVPSQGPLQTQPSQQALQVTLHDRKRNTFVRIVEQPASKALRFRYECEGRSAGSIPGIHSTPENKTYPSIEIVGYKGRAVVVVSCVTKDPPYRPHPHNLVGKDGCKKGVCTVEINSESMSVSFSNLGIQCVKKKDLEEALRVREEIRVDPFRTGFSHRNQPTSIDLNAVRLCFQVFLEGELKGRFTLPLTPVVSDVIYDKKAMSDLVICKMSHCTATVAGGKEVILLCEKVAKEDISVRFYEEIDGQIVWEACGDFQHANVHKQVAISFRTPIYKTLDVEQPIKVFIQLRRPSDNATSEALPFELLPLDSGRSGVFRRRNKELSILSKILAEEASRKALSSVNEIETDGNNNKDESCPVIILQSPSVEDEDENIGIKVVASSDQSTSITTDSIVASLTDSIQNGTNLADDLRESIICDQSLDNSDILNGNFTDEVGNTEKSLNELLDQVAELDEIYSENRTRLETLAAFDDSQAMDIDIDDFDDSNTYTSLQLAYKNPVSIAEPEEIFSYEDILTVQGPIIELAPLKRDPYDEKLPPLPPKRIRKTPSVEVLKPILAVVPQGSVESIIKPGKSVAMSRSQSQSQHALSSPTDQPLPPTPTKKRSFLARLFQRKPRKEKTPASNQVKTPKSKPAGRSVSSVSGQRPSKFRQAVSHTSLKDSSSNLSVGTSLRYADSITHISLHGDDTPSPGSLKRPASFVPLPQTLGNDTILVAENVLAIDASALRKLQDNLDLTEAEHYALYMAIAPHATSSEFDETSCYYSPVEGDPVVLKRKRRKFAEDPNNILRQLQQSQQEISNVEAKLQNNIYNLFVPVEPPIKVEPRDKTPSPYGGQNNSFGNYRVMQNSPSPQHYIATPSPPLNIIDYQQPGQIWNIPPSMPQVLPGMNLPGPSGMIQQQPQPQVQTESHATLSSLLMDMDSQQLMQYSLPNSADLSGFSSILDTYQPHQEGKVAIEQENMTDSFTRLTTNTINELTGANGLNVYAHPQ